MSSWSITSSGGDTLDAIGDSLTHAASITNGGGDMPDAIGVSLTHAKGIISGGDMLVAISDGVPISGSAHAGPLTAGRRSRMRSGGSRKRERRAAAGGSTS